MITVVRKKLHETGRKVLAGLLTAAMLTGCNIWEDLPECPPEVSNAKVWFSFSFTYHNIQEDNGQYKELFGETATRTDLFIFDKGGTLVKLVTDQQGPFTDNYRVPVELPDGEYRAVAWNNLYDSGYTKLIPDAIEGVTNIEDLKVQLTELNSQKITLQPATMLYGETNLFTLTSSSENNTDKTIPISLIRNIHELNFAINWRDKKTKELCPFWSHADSTRIYIDDNNGTIDFTNRLQPTDAFTYIPKYLSGAQAGKTKQLTDESNAATLRAESSVLRLFTSSKHILRICRLQPDGSEKEVYRRNLMSDFISPIYKTQEEIDRQGIFNIEIEFECEHPDPNIKWVAISISINGWKLSDMGDIEPGN